MRFSLSILISLLFISITPSAPVVIAEVDQGLEQQLQQVLTDFHEQNPTIPGIMVALESGQLNLHWRGGAGVADVETNVAITPDQPLRLASTTKTYVAAAILRLMEQGKLTLDDTLDQHLPEHQVDLLAGDGYRPDVISIRQVLTHTSGLFDHARRGGGYINAVLANPARRWSRDEQLTHLVNDGDPVGTPGERFHYSDSGYILLGEILERRTAKSLAGALRSLLKFDELGLRATWLESMEPAPKNIAQRASQYVEDMNITSIDPTMDLYGGGGLVTTMYELSRFYRALFEGKVFENPHTLTVMKRPVITEQARSAMLGAENKQFAYSMGLYASELHGYTIFSHGGAWGTEGGYLPSLGLSWGMATTAPSRQRQVLRNALLEVIIDSAEKKQFKH